MVVFVREVWGLARSNSAECRWFGWVTDNGGFRLHICTARIARARYGLRITWSIYMYVRQCAKAKERKMNG